MRTSYSNRPKPRRQQGPLFAGGVGILIILFLLLNVIPASPLYGLLYQAAAPIWRLKQSVLDGFSESLSLVHAKITLERENAALRDRLRVAEERLFALQILEAENERLKGFLSRSDSKKRLLGTVLVRPPRSPYDTLVIDVGIKDGVTAGDLVLSPGGIAIGEITEAFKEFARATLFSAPGREANVLIGEKAISGRAVGVGGGAFQLLLPRELEITVGDSVTFSGITPTLVATVSSIENRDVDFLQLITFTSPVNFQEIRYVAVLLGTAPASHSNER